MDCHSARLNAAAAALGALGELELAEMRRHLACCPGCHADSERARRAVRIAEGGNAVLEIGGLVRRIVAAGRAELDCQNKRSVSPWPRLAAALCRAVRKPNAVAERAVRPAAWTRNQSLGRT